MRSAAEPDTSDPFAESTLTRSLGGVRRGWRYLAGFFALFAVAMVCGVWWRQSIHEASAVVIGALGLSGLFGVVWLIDSVPTPLSYLPLIVFALDGHASTWEVLGVCYGGSLLGSLSGFCLGRYIGMPRRLSVWMRRRHPRALSLIERSSVYGVALVGFLPLPMALGTWTAGATRAPLLGVAVACHARMVKTALFVTLILGGLGLGDFGHR